ncbi:MAG: hypothetical protein ACREHC_04360 [Candidatus Levyibacteriota bacterium]
MAMPEGLTPDVAHYLKKKDPAEKPQKKPWLSEPIPLSQVRERFLHGSPEGQPFSKIAAEIAEITGSWNPVELLTPTNVQSEQENFFAAIDKGEIYNPQFTYTVLPIYTSELNEEHLLFLQRQVRECKPSRDDRLGRIARIALDYKIRDDLATVDIARAMTSRTDASTKDQAIKQALSQKYPGTDDVLWRAAQEDFARRTQSTNGETKQTGILTKEEQEYLETREFDAEDFKIAIEWALSQYGILKIDNEPNSMGFTVVIDPAVTAIDVRDKSANGPTVFIPADKKENGIKLLKIIGHEIEGHARQSVNGQLLFGIGGGPLKVDNEMLYEGEGKYNDDLVSRILTGETTATALPVYTYAVRAAENGASFYEIYQQQLQMYLQMELHISDPADLPPLEEIDSQKVTKGKDLGWRRSYRVMRGHTDTTNREAFANAKDLAYKRGEMIVEDLRQHDLGYLNEAGIIASGGLQLLAEFAISENDLPLPHKGVAIRYWHEVLQPQMFAE